MKALETKWKFFSVLNLHTVFTPPCVANLKKYIRGRIAKEEDFKRIPSLGPFRSLFHKDFFPPSTDSDPISVCVVAYLN